MSIKKVLYRIIAVISICFVYVCLSISPIFFRTFSKQSNKNAFKVIAHRGASHLAPENTLASINAALKLHPNSIEIDVQQTLDAVVVLMHDITLNRTTNGSGLIKEKLFKDVSKLDAGSWFSNDFRDEKIPTLEEAIRLTKGKCQLIIEIKKGNDFYPDIVQNIVRIIKKLDAEAWVVIHSFNYQVLKSVHKLNSDIPLQKLFVGKFKCIPFIFSDKIETLDLEKYPYIEAYNINYIFANRGVINFLKSNGKKVNVWTVNNANTAQELIMLGVDGIITDNPSIMND